MTALAVLENGRSIGGKRLMFDAQLYLPDSENKSILAALYYYNDRDIIFPSVGTHVVHASVRSKAFSVTK